MTDAPLSENAPRFVTAHDLIKTAAVMSMIADHLGVFFFPHALWLRAAGRFAGPVWFFLPGYSRSRAQPRRVWIAVAGLAGLSLVTGGGLFPVSALATIMVTRAAIDPLMRRMLRSWTEFWFWYLILFLLILPTSFFFEYGTLALLVGAYGYIARHEATVATARRLRTTRLAIFGGLLAAGLAVLPLSFRFTLPQLGSIAVAWIVMLIWFARFRPKDYPRLSAFPPLAWLLRFTGRYTLEIYVVHLAAFRIAAWWLAPGHAPGIAHWRLFATA